MIDNHNVNYSETALIEDLKQLPLCKMDEDEDEVKNNQPKVMICCKENSYAVKDICIDEGIPKDKLSTEKKTENLNGNADELEEYNQVLSLKDNLGNVSQAKDKLEMEKTFVISDSYSKPPTAPTDGGNSRRQEEGSLDISNNESSFGQVSGLITYSGPISYAGSISIRSDSSTTSTRSFAFPVLQSEWNSSPVRMAKAERRHYRRHRGWWRHGLLCCRF